MSTENPQTTQKNEQMEAERSALIAQMRELDGDEPESAPNPKPDPPAAEQAAATSESDSVEKGEVVGLVEGEPPKAAEAKGDSKEAKEEARLAKSWKQVEAEKAAVRAEKAEVDRLKAEAAEKAVTAGQYKPEDYLAAAKRWEAEGETELAQEARDKAKSLQVQIAEAKQNQAREKYKAEWDAAVAQAKTDNEELTDPESPLTKTVQEIFKNRPVFTTYPGGVADAVKVAQMKLQSEKVESIQAERDKLQARVDELEKKLQPGGATVSPERSAKTFEEMSLDEQGAILRRAARDADNSGEGIAALNMNN